MRYGSGLKCGCGFSMYTSVGLNRKELTETELEQLLNGETIYVDGLRSQKRNTYAADIRLKRDGKFDMKLA